MSVATATEWFFNFLLALTFPRFRASLGETGTFFYYAVWCVIGTVMIFL